MRHRFNLPICCVQVMGAPLAGSPVQASVLTGGTIRFKGLRPKLQSKRIQMICECGGPLCSLVLVTVLPAPSACLPRLPACLCCFQGEC
jgi:hypothetical protein